MTWLSGVVLLFLVYYSSSGLIDPDIAALSQARGIAIGLAVLAGGWIIYDRGQGPPSAGRKLPLRHSRYS